LPISMYLNGRTVSLGEREVREESIFEN